MGIQGCITKTCSPFRYTYTPVLQACLLPHMPRTQSSAVLCVCVCVCVQLTAGAEGGLKEEAFLHDAQAGAAAERVRLHAAVPGDGAAPGTGGAGQVY